MRIMRAGEISHYRVLEKLGEGATGAWPLGPDTGRLPPLLESRGIAAESIGAVVLTHGHPDHIGGVTDASCRAQVSKRASYHGCRGMAILDR
jgi:glyoxylase-like metal-dependent hydrolase (beta-lactamase superfamily II)